MHDSINIYGLLQLCVSCILTIISLFLSEPRPERAGVHELRQDHPRARRPRGVLRRPRRRTQLVPQDLRVHLPPWMKKKDGGS